MSPAGGDPRRGLANPPGRGELRYRVGTYDSFVAQMLDRLVLNLEVEASGFAGASSEAGAVGTRHFVRFNLDEADNWLIALTRSWATVADVLTFYQERLVQEGFLRTAVEERSVYELVDMVAYQPRPGVSGRADLAIQVTDVKGLPPTLELPSRLVVRSVPPPGAEPQAFETMEALFADAGFNALTPRPLPREAPPDVRADATGLRLAGTATGLAVGNYLLLVAVAGGRPISRLRRLTAVAAVPGESPHTEVAWEAPLMTAATGVAAETRLAEVKAFSLRRQAGLFGRNAPPWNELTPDLRRKVEGVDGGVVVLEGDRWVSRNDGLPVTTTVLSLLADRHGNLYAGTLDQGVFRSTDGGASWRPARRGLQQLDVRCLAVDPRGVLYAGTSGGGVFRSTDQGQIWEPASGQRTAAASGRRWPWSRGTAGTATLPQAVIHDLLAARWGDVSVVLAATGAGIYRSTEGGQTWQPANHGLAGTDEASGTTDLAVQALVAGAAPQEVYAATARGVFRSTDGGRRWQPRNRGLPATDPFTGFSATPVHAVAVVAGRRQAGVRLVAGSARGLFVSDDGGDHWQARPLGATAAEPPPVTRVTLSEDPMSLDRRLFAAAENRLWQSTDDGESWQPVAPFQPGPVAAVAAVPVSGGATALAALPFGGFGDEWPGFHLSDGNVDLDSLVDGVLPGSWLVLVPAGSEDPSAVGIYRVRRVGTVHRRDCSLDAMVTRLQVDDPDGRLAGFDLRETRVWLDSRPLPLERRIVENHGVALEVLRVTLDGFDPLRRLIVTGERPARRFEAPFEPGGHNDELRAIADEMSALDPDLELVVRMWPAGAAADAAPTSELLLSLADLIRNLRLLAAADEPDRTAADDEAGAERDPDAVAASLASLQRLVGGAAGDGTAPELTMAAARGVVGALRFAFVVPSWTDGCATTAAELSKSLRQPIATDAVDSGLAVHLPSREPEPGALVDSASLRVYGNVVAAVEGTTVANEVLGDGDATQANQTFTLSRPPSFRLEPEGLVSTVRVRVQGQLWHPQEQLYAAGPEDHVYRLDVDQDGFATLVFGNGEKGARLPSGRDNVVATYGTGMSTRSVPAKGVSLLQNRPLGLDSVLNPLATTPGADAEPVDEIRQRAPRSVRTLDRVVSLVDFADFALAFPGIAKAGAWSLRRAGQPLVQVTVAAAGGHPMEDGGALLDELRDAVDLRRAGGAALSLLDYEPAVIELTANLLVDPDFVWSTVEQDVRRRLAERFGFARAEFGGSVSAAAVVRTIQAAPGVVAVDLDEMVAGDQVATAGGSADAGRELTARPARVDDGRLRAAELLLLGEVTLRQVGAP